MASTLASPLRTAARLDYSTLRRAAFGFGLIFLLIAPASPDPLALGVGAFTPWLLLRLIGRPTMPLAIVYYLLSQWLQVFARAFLALVDGEPMAQSIFGPWVVNAYWYMLTSTVVLAVVCRVVLGSISPPTPQNFSAHLAWRPVDVFLVYLGANVVAQVGGLTLGGGLFQFFESVARFKIVAAFLLFTSVMQTGRGWSYLIAIVLVEIGSGMTGLLGDFRGVFVFLGTAALAAQIRWTLRTSASAFLAGFALVFLALFWTSVKTEYREYATGGSESQALQLSLSDRAEYMLGRVARIGDIDWALTSKALLERLAYVDITGLVINVDQAGSEPSSMRQWSDAFSHVLRPRFLFPDKEALSDTEVYIRLTKADLLENMRGGTSISVGYMAENYVDLGFPGMLAGVFAVGLLVALVIRFFFSFDVPWMVRQGAALAYVYSICASGLEVSLPKLLGSSLTFAVAYGLILKFAFPIGRRWLDRRARQAVVTTPRRTGRVSRRGRGSPH
ncbi:MAG: hypothetical protein B7Y08_16220 [Rhodospirillales bacterium 24-66-33]|uniref:hypothetical protein n=2 Tax=Reyranella sp. TaxID=1929291 RepID=UPI000BDD81C5|nr:hypothetical protein [Reyranella sp.]OYY41250.1 MAG: hypothetical protein B7Y57_14145 [Rhodospirillales bacterium 35-66-84]OYZ93448.1 MAG: hypothetical protein B7Y08_16220 [Rhodospirillales bacterium 24-66-33]OZB21857.1 MAG: hypothetical protein B7X63_26045 [Rhodospirillales bacterium 39-66-50]HQS16390.1 hypothetical protein [Reyranella sp.]HQT12221.1 hypothetical protein [Reyranella sp.]